MFFIVRKAKGPRSGSRHKMQTRRRATVSDHLKEFAMGDRVAVKLQPNMYNKGYPYITYHGVSGSVVEKRGRSYVVEFHDKDKKKWVILSPVHLKRL